MKLKSTLQNKCFVKISRQISNQEKAHLSSSVTYTNLPFIENKKHEHVRLILQNAYKLDGSLPANPVNDRRIANAVTLKSTFHLP